MSGLHFKCVGVCVCVCVCMCKQHNETKFAKTQGVIEEADLIKVHYMHVRKYHNEIALYS
jgi:hypothetical protein